MDRIRRLASLLAAGVPGRRRRLETAEEIRGHLEDLAEESRFLGLEGRAAVRYVLERFGRPAPILRGLREANRRAPASRWLAAAAAILLAILAGWLYAPAPPSPARPAPAAAAPALEDPAKALARLDARFLSARRDGLSFLSAEYGGESIRLRYEWTPGEDLILAEGPAEGGFPDLAAALDERVLPLVPSAPSEWVSGCRLSWDAEACGRAVLARPENDAGVAPFEALRIRLGPDGGLDRVEALRGGRWLSCETGMCSIDGRLAVLSTRLEGSPRTLVRRLDRRNDGWLPAGLEVRTEDGRALRLDAVRLFSHRLESL